MPAGSGPTSGQWDAGAGSAFIGPIIAAARAAGPSFLHDTGPAIIEALAAFAARFATPTAVLGALLIPTPNSGGVTDGTLPGAPNIRFHKDGPEGTLRIATKTDDGTEVVVRTENQLGVYVDIETGKPLGRDFGDQMYLDLDSVHPALDAACQPGEKESRSRGRSLTSRSCARDQRRIPRTKQVLEPRITRMMSTLASTRSRLSREGSASRS